MRFFLFSSLLAAHLLASHSFAKEATPTITLEKGDVAVTVKVDGELFTKYVYADQKRVKPILYPVIGPNGVPMTRRYPIEEAAPGEAKDHPHHASLWYTASA